MPGFRLRNRGVEFWEDALTCVVGLGTWYVLPSCVGRPGNLCLPVVWLLSACHDVFSALDRGLYVPSARCCCVSSVIDLFYQGSR